LLVHPHPAHPAASTKPSKATVARSHWGDFKKL
jgi:hypothetical protein